MNKVIQNITKSISNLPKTINTSSINTNFKDLLHSRVLLYAFLAISLIDLFYFTQIRDNISIAIFVLVGFMTTFFSKNMIVVLCIALVVTHILKFGIRTVISEGFEEEEDKDKENMETEEEDKENMENKEDEIQDTDEKKKDFEEFQAIQDKILGGMKELDPLITKAEGFIEKYSHLIKE